jgi:hypothetical protein
MSRLRPRTQGRRSNSVSARKGKTCSLFASDSGKRASQCQRGRDRPKQDVLHPPFSIIRQKRKDQQNIMNCGHRDNCQQGGARKTHTGEVRLLRTVTELRHFGATLSVEKLQSRIFASTTRATGEADRSRRDPSVTDRLDFCEVP